MLLHFRFIALLLACLWVKPALAVVSVSQSVTDIKDDGIWNQLNISADGSSGNSETETFKAKLLSQWKHGAHAEFLMLHHAYGTSGGSVNKDQSFVHLRHRTEIAERWSAEGFAQLEQDAFKRLLRRTLFGAGMRFLALEEADKYGVYLGLGAFDENERIQGVNGVPESENHEVRLNSYLVLAKQFNPQVSMSSTTYYQPAIGDSGNYRLLEELSMRVKVFEDINLKLDIDYSYNAVPPAQVNPSDFTYSTGIEVLF